MPLVVLPNVRRPSAGTHVNRLRANGSMSSHWWTATWAARIGVSSCAMWPGVSVSGTGGVVTLADIAVFAEKRGVPLPDALAALYLRSGIGTFGGFLHFEAPEGMCTHRELIEHL